MYKKILILLLFVFWALPALSETTIDTAWVRKYNGPENAYDAAWDVEVDAYGNVYVTGESWSYVTSYDYVTIKYYPNGDTAWIRRYKGAGNSLDVGRAIVTDDSGFAYVTGWSEGTGWHTNYTTIKYYPNGDTVWLRRYNGLGDSDDEPFAMILDGAGNIYVTGRSIGSGTDYDYATTKYYPNGDTAWVRRYNGPGNSGDDASAIAVDNSGSVYVAGASYGSGTSSDYATIKYYPNGDTAWVRRYNGSGNSTDDASAIVVDNSGNVYVTGKSGGNGTNRDLVTIKYDATSGEELWVSRYSGPGNDGAYAIAMDGSGNAYVTGYSYGSGTDYDYITIKYGESGWVRRYNGPGSGRDEAFAIAVDDSDNVYVTGGSFGSGTSDDCVTIKYVQFEFLRGDANGDGVINVSDVVYLLNYLFIGGPAPQPWQAGDANCDGKVNSADVVYLINYLFVGGPPPSC